MRLCSYTDHVIKRKLGYPRAFNHKNPLDDTSIMSPTETVASGLEAINIILPHSFSLICQQDFLVHQSRDHNSFKYLHYVIDLEAFSTGNYVMPSHRK